MGVPALLVPSLADEVVLLRPWHETDVPAHLKAFGDPLFQRFSDWAPDTEAGARAYLAEHEQARQRGEQIEFALVEPHDENVMDAPLILDGTPVTRCARDCGDVRASGTVPSAWPLISSPGIHTRRI